MEIVYRHFIIVLLLFFILNESKYKNNFLQSITISHFFAIKYKMLLLKQMTQNFFILPMLMENSLTFVQIQPQVALCSFYHKMAKEKTVYVCTNCGQD